MEKEYIVSLQEGIDYDQFWIEIESPTVGATYVPDRSVDIVNVRPGSTRSCHYSLTDEEAEILRADPRVIGVDLPPEQRTDISVGPCVQQVSDFTKTGTGSGAYVNWGLLRSSVATNIYGTGYTTTKTYDYHLDGTGVDIVVIDSGLQVDHPEFFNTKGVSRVQQIDWYAASGGMVPGSMPANHYRDLDGHGTHCMGIAAGLNYGWAKNANLYSVKMRGLDVNDPLVGLPTIDCFEVVKWFHLNKTPDPVTKIVRPTVVNMSFGWSWNNLITATNGVYRGTAWSATNPLYNTTSLRTAAFGVQEFQKQPYQYSAIDVCIAELTAAGVIVCIAGSNDSYKHDVSTGLDYNNNVNSSYYYHRASSPHDVSAIKVGSLDIYSADATTDRVASYSKKGPAMNIWAPGTNIMSATSTTNRFGGAAYNFAVSGGFKQCNISGTSMATPQVVGILALYAQANPSATPAQAKDFLIKNSKSTIYSTGLDNDYSNVFSLLGSDNCQVFFPYASNTGINASASATATLKR